MTMKKNLIFLKKNLIFLYDFVFPNTVLPNALIAEFGLIQYLNSLHTENSNSNILEKEHGTGDLTLLGAVFESSLGSQSNSLSGCHVVDATNWVDGFSATTSSLYEGRKNHNKYIYPIRVTPHIDNFTGFGHVGQKINGEYFWKHMSNIALNDARQGKAFILLDYAQENNISRHTFENLHTSLRLSKIPKEQIILIMNSFNAKEVYESWFEEGEQQLTVINFPFVSFTSSRHFSLNKNYRMNVNEFLDLKNKIRDHHYIFKIRRPRHHRLALLLKMHSENMLDKADWSCLQNIQIDENLMNDLRHRYQISIDDEKCKLLVVPHNLSTEKNLSYSTVSAWTDTDYSAHINSYLYVCTDTYVDVPYKFFTEKVFKPIANFQPFLLMSYPGALRLLRELGFKTFSPFINEDYDEEPDVAKRLNLILAELDKICKLSKSEIHDWYWSMQDILIHNHTHLMNFWKTNSMVKDALDYFFVKLQ